MLTVTSEVLTALLLHKIAQENTEVSSDKDLLRQRATRENQ